ncbi:MAG: hypothetical protein MRZ79_04615 [Bacteroidia bacterium]|nr:hypothetical protein [Bacteroidia bacterium]
MNLFSRSILLICLALGLVKCQTPMNVSQKKEFFPEVSTKTLAGNDLVFPQGIKGKKAFIALVMEERGAYMTQQNEANSWNSFYENELKSQGVEFYEIPMMAGGYVLARGWIDSGMRSGIDPAKHANVACFYGNKKKYMKAFDISDMGTAHLFLLDEEGRILAQTTGASNPEKTENFLKALK